MNSHLKSLAYRLLGSVSEADDILQEAHLRLHQTNPKPDSEEAFLYRVVSNLCVDKLRRAKVRRHHYVGPWLPEPIVADSAELTDMAEQLSMGYMLMLERLSPAERVVYVLREGFDFDFAEIADVLGTSVANARQRAHRARKRLRDVEPPLLAPEDEQKAVIEAFLLRLAERDIGGLVALMSEDAIAYTDGGGVVSAAIQPIHEPARIAQVALHLAAKLQQDSEVIFKFLPMNGGQGLILLQDGVVQSCVQIGVINSLVNRIYVVRNPEKLKHLSDMITDS